MVSYEGVFEEVLDNELRLDLMNVRRRSGGVYQVKDSVRIRCHDRSGGGG